MFYELLDDEYFTFNSEKKQKLLHETAYNLLGKVVLDLYNLDISLTEIHKNEHGKPYFYDVRFSHIKFNLSHCDGLAVCVLSENEVGVDAEKIKEYRPKVAKRCFSESENIMLNNIKNKDLYFYQIWTLKEAFVKAIGVGISYPMKTISFDLNNDGKNIRCSDNGFSFWQKTIEGKFIISVCEKID